MRNGASVSILAGVTDGSLFRVGIQSHSTHGKLPYAHLVRSQDAFFRDFAAAFSKLVSLGCPKAAQPRVPCTKTQEKEQFSTEVCMIHSPISRSELWEQT